MTGYYIKASDIVLEYFSRNDKPMPKNLNRYISEVIRAERMIDTGSSRTPFKHFLRRGLDVEFAQDENKILLPNNMYRLNMVKTEDGQALSFYQNGRHVYINGDIGFEIDVVVITYEGLMVDKKLNALVSASHDEVLIDALELYELKEDYKEGKVPRYIYQDFKDEWGDKVIDARAKDMAPDDLTLAIVSDIHNSLITPKYIDFQTGELDNGAIVIDKYKPE